MDRFIRILNSACGTKRVDRAAKLAQLSADTGIPVSTINNMLCGQRKGRVANDRVSTLLRAIHATPEQRAEVWTELGVDLEGLR